MNGRVKILAKNFTDQIWEVEQCLKESSRVLSLPYICLEFLFCGTSLFAENIIDKCMEN